MRFSMILQALILFLISGSFAFAGKLDGMSLHIYGATKARMCGGNITGCQKGRQWTYSATKVYVGKKGKRVFGYNGEQDGDLFTIGKWFNLGGGKSIKYTLRGSSLISEAKTTDGFYVKNVYTVNPSGKCKLSAKARTSNGARFTSYQYKIEKCLVRNGNVFAK